MLIIIMASIFALLLTCMNNSSINVEDDTFPPVKRNLVIEWDAFVSNATKNLREKIRAFSKHLLCEEKPKKQAERERKTQGS